MGGVGLDGAGGTIEFMSFLNRFCGVSGLVLWNQRIICFAFCFY